MNFDMPQSLQNAIVDGLTGLLALRLRGSPAVENVKQTAAVWVAAIASRPIAWDVDQDLPRIRAAFVELSATAKQWPAPSDFLAVMPPRKPILKLTPPAGEKMTAENRQRLDDLMKKLRNGRQNDVESTG